MVEILEKALWGSGLELGGLDGQRTKKQPGVAVLVSSQLLWY